MKKILTFLIISLAMVSCYDDYLKDFDYSSVYFTYQVNVRTLVVGEGMKIEIGAALGGMDNNVRDRNVSFTIDNSLISPATLTLMKNGSAAIKNAVSSVTTLALLPTNYYTLSDYDKFVIKSGSHLGTIVLKADSAAFLADPSTMIPNYAIPFRITQADADSIIPDLQTTVIGIKYENMLYGNYWHGGRTIVKNPSGIPVDTIFYYTTIPCPEIKIWKLTTIGPNVLVTNGYSDQTTSKGEMRLTLDGSNIIVSTNTGSTFAVTPDGSSTFNQARLLQNRKIFLSYKYINSAGNTCYAQDTLTFRNRIRDGINEWQDENPSHYLK